METAIQSRPRLRAKVAFTALIWVIIAWGFAYWIVAIVQNITLPQLEYTEGFIQFNAHQFINGQWSWNPNVGPPYAVSFYPPIYYLIYSGLILVFGESIVIARVFVLVCAAVGMFFIYLILNHYTKNRFISLTGALLPLSQPFFFGWSIISRVDIPAATFELIGIYLFIRFWKTKWLFTSAILFVLTFFTKQSYSAGAVACILFLLIKDRKSGFAYAGMVMMPIALILAVGSILTDGGLIKSMFLYQRTLPTYKPIGDVLALTAVSYFPLIPLIILAVKRFIKNKLDIIGIYFITACIINLALIGRHGGSTNYALQVIFPLVIAGALELEWVLEQKSQHILHYFLITLFLVAGRMGFVPYPDSNYQDRYNEVKSIISNATYPILTENAGVVLDAGKVPYYEGFTFSQLNNFGYWDNSRLIQDLEHQKIEYIISERPLPYHDSLRYSSELDQIILNNYQIVYMSGMEGGNFRLVVYQKTQGRVK